MGEAINLIENFKVDKVIFNCGEFNKLEQELIKVLDSINIGLASKELYTLLSMYKVLVHLEEKYDENTKDFDSVRTKKIKVENKLRREIVLGYCKYHNKLGIKGGIDNDFLELKDDEFIFMI